MLDLFDKVAAMWHFLFKYEINEAEWFVKADTDAYLSVNNVKGFLQYYDYNLPHFLGKTLHGRLQCGHDILTNGGGYYVLGRRTLTHAHSYFIFQTLVFCFFLCF